ncbi:MAG: glutamine amidotransferase [Polyangiaceae bacterium]
MNRGWALSGDLASPFVLLACVLSAASVAFLAFELFRGRRKPGSAPIALTGAVAVGALLLAVLRPVTIASRGTTVGSRVVVLLDGSRSMDLPGDSGTRRATGLTAVEALSKRATDVRLSVLRFGDGAPSIVDLAAPGGAASAPFRPSARSDLGGALEALAQSSDEPPRAIVVLSDGRLDRPAAESAGPAVRAALGSLDVPVHTVSVATDSPRDASVRAVRIAGAAVAHQPLALRIEIGCTGGLACDEIPVLVRELHESGEPRARAQATARVEHGAGTIEVPVTLDRAGTRILEVSLRAPDGDEIPENNVRYITTVVTRDRVRVLHVAGRPTYDVRALRMWLKSDASVDLVAFFILRTPDDDVNATQDELALIPFPVDELFSQHLSSFDAVVLQDFNARPYGLEKYLPTLARYVQGGGGLIMVGGPDAFVTGHYAGSALADILPVDLRLPESENPVDLGTFVPRITDIGRAAPVLTPLRDMIGDAFPDMPGTNVVGDARGGATVLLAHPTRKTRSGAPMPVLALGEAGSGRTIALTVDGSHKLLFSTFAAESAAGRAHGAFWDALLGWLMKDPRFEPAVVDVPGGCIAGEPTTLLLRPLPGQRGEATVKIARLGDPSAPARTLTVKVPGDGQPVELPVGPLTAGGYSVSAEIGEGGEKGAAARRDFACEKGGDEWADPRPDNDRLHAIADATSGTFVKAKDIDSLPLPAATEVAAERRVNAVLPPWAWTLFASLVLGAHWILRRRTGLA